MKVYSMRTCFTCKVSRPLHAFTFIRSKKVHTYHCTACLADEKATQQFLKQSKKDEKLFQQRKNKSIKINSIILRKSKHLQKDNTN